MLLKNQRDNARKRAQKKNAKASQATPPQGPQWGMDSAGNPLRPRHQTQSQPCISFVIVITLITL